MGFVLRPRNFSPVILSEAKDLLVLENQILRFAQDDK